MTPSARRVSLLVASIALGLAVPRGIEAQTFTFQGVTLQDGGEAIQDASIQVRVKEAGRGYTRADYFDASGRRLGFYEAFEVVAREEDALRAWAARNFGDRTGGRR
jgi:hypothetical protein